MENSTNSLRELRALLVEDDTSIQFLLRQILEKAGCVVTEAAEGTQAAAMFETIRPDIILLDCVLPGIDGFEACAAIRAIPGGDRVPVLMITVLTDEASIDRAYQAGATDYITKPVQVEMLFHRVRNALWAKLLEDNLIRSKKEWEATFDTVSDMILLTNVEGVILRLHRSEFHGAGCRPLRRYLPEQTNCDGYPDCRDQKSPAGEVGIGAAEPTE